jgi:uncharacterized protein with HEPN domain
VLRVRDLLLAIQRIAEYTQGMTYATFSTDNRTIDAVVRNIAIIGEASRALPEDFKAAHSHLPWREMADMRNVVVHMYHLVDASILWQTIQQDLPPLVQSLELLVSGPSSP